MFNGGKTKNYNPSDYSTAKWNGWRDDVRVLEHISNWNCGIHTETHLCASLHVTSALSFSAWAPKLGVKAAAFATDILLKNK